MTPDTAVLTFMCSCTSKVRKFVCLGFRFFAITQSRATVLTFRYWCRRIVMKPRGWQSASPTLLLLCRSPPAQSSAVLHYVKLTAFVLNGMSLLPNNCGVLFLKGYCLIKSELSYSLRFEGYFVFFANGIS